VEKEEAIDLVSPDPPSNAGRPQPAALVASPIHKLPPLSTVTPSNPSQKQQPSVAPVPPATSKSAAASKSAEAAAAREHKYTKARAPTGCRAAVSLLLRLCTTGAARAEPVTMGWHRHRWGQAFTMPTRVTPITEQHHGRDPRVAADLALPKVLFLISLLPLLSRRGGGLYCCLHCRRTPGPHMTCLSPICCHQVWHILHDGAGRFTSVLPG
jgi:hypothetical protein